MTKTNILENIVRKEEPPTAETNEPTTLSP